MNADTSETGTGDSSTRVEECAILLVDDDRAWGDSTATILEHQREGFTVTTATTLADAGEAFAAGSFDCVVCDYRLEHGTGLELLGEVRDVDPDRPFLLVTGEGSESVASEAISRQVTDYLPKRTIGGRNDRLARRIESTVRTYRTERALEKERRSKEAMLEIVRATTDREGLAQDFCEHLVAERGYDCAWIGMEDAGVLVPRAVAGEAAYFEAIADVSDEPMDVDEPARVALDRRATFVEETIEPEGSDRDSSEHADESGWRAIADEFGFQRAAAVPIEHEGSVFGVLAVYATRAELIDDAELTVLGEYGETIGYALRTAEWKRSLVSTTPVVVTFEIDDEAAPLVAVARRLDPDVRLRVLTAAFREDGLLYVLDVEGASAAAVEAVAEGVEDVRSVRVDESSDRCDLVVSGETPEGVLVDRGSRVVDATVEHSRASVTVVRPDDEDVGTLIRELQAHFPGAKSTSIRSKRRVDREESVDHVLGALTAKQLQAIELAYFQGYFERPREHNTTEIAAKLDVNRATFTQHLRAAERKVLSRLLDPTE